MNPPLAMVELQKVRRSFRNLWDRWAPNAGLGGAAGHESAAGYGRAAEGYL